MRILVGAGGEEIARDVKTFAQQVITTVTGYVTQMDERERDRFRVAASDREQRPGRATTTSGTFGLEKVLRLGIGREVQTFAEAIERERGGGEMVATARSLVDTLRAQNAELMLILDDTDTWLNLPGVDKRELADVFLPAEIATVGMHGSDHRAVDLAHERTKYGRARGRSSPSSESASCASSSNCAAAPPRVPDRATHEREPLARLPPELGA